MTTMMMNTINSLRCSLDHLEQQAGNVCREHGNSHCNSPTGNRAWAEILSKDGVRALNLFQERYEQASEGYGWANHWDFDAKLRNAMTFANESLLRWDWETARSTLDPKVLLQRPPGVAVEMMVDEVFATCSAVAFLLEFHRTLDNFDVERSLPQGWQPWPLDCWPRANAGDSWPKEAIEQIVGTLEHVMEDPARYNQARTYNANDLLPQSIGCLPYVLLGEWLMEQQQLRELSLGQVLQLEISARTAPSTCQDQLSTTLATRYPIGAAFAQE